MNQRRGSGHEAERDESRRPTARLPDELPNYPETPRDRVWDDYHGTRVADPFRWLEDADSPETVRWTAQQNEATSQFLSRCSDRDRVGTRLRELWRYRRSSLPRRVGRRTFTVEADSSRQQPVLYLVEDEDAATVIELVDPNGLAADGTAALTGWTVSPDGAWLAYAISHGGGDRQEIRVRDVGTRLDLPEVIRWTKSEEDLPFPNVAWQPDGSGFYYNRLPTPGTVASEDEYRHSQVYWHRLETPQDDDVLVFDRPDDPDLNFVPIVTDDGRYLVLHAWRGLSHRHEVYVRSIDPSSGFSHLLPNADARYVFIGSVHDRFLFHTTAGAPRGRVIGIDLDRPQPDAWHEVVPEQADPIVHGAVLGDRIILVTVRDAHHRLSTFELTGTPGPRIELPDLGTVEDLAFDQQTGELLVEFGSFLRPAGTLRFDPRTGSRTSEHVASIPFDVAPYTTRQVFVSAPDGTNLPVTLVHKIGLTLDGANPVLLYGYGGFDLSMTPRFDASRLLWLESGGVYAMANPRGGGEYGEAWHEAGMRHRKQTVFDDFMAVAGWLVDSGYTTPSRLAIGAESNGGLLVAACMLQHPASFGAVVCSIPVTDMLRYARFTIGRYWVPEYGDAEADVDDFQTLYRYSPVHNVGPSVAYPPILITTGSADDRVVPAHAMKYAAALQSAAFPGASPRLLRVQSEVGHGLGKPMSKVLELDTDIYTFLLAAMGMTLPQA